MWRSIKYGNIYGNLYTETYSDEKCSSDNLLVAVLRMTKKISNTERMKIYPPENFFGDFVDKNKYPKQTNNQRVLKINTMHSYHVQLMQKLKHPDYGYRLNTIMQLSSMKNSTRKKLFGLCIICRRINFSQKLKCN